MVLSLKVTTVLYVSLVIFLSSLRLCRLQGMQIDYYCASFKGIDAGALLTSGITGRQYSYFRFQ